MYLNKTQICERGWSMKMIGQFLGKPDDIKPLGRYAEEHLYFLPRIEKTENSGEFKTAQEKYLKRRDAGKRAAKKQAEDRIETAKTMPIIVKRLPIDVVVEKAIEHFNYRKQSRWNYDYDDYWEFTPADQNSGQEFLARITVNYIRHNLTSYDAKIFKQKGRIGGDEAVPIIRRRVFEEIQKTYAFFAAECDRQMIERGLKDKSEIKKEIKIYGQQQLPF